MKKHDRTNRLLKAIDLPPDVVHLPQIELLGNREMVVEGCQGILEYTDCFIKLSTEKITIAITGRNLQIRTMNRLNVVIEGFIGQITMTE